VGGEKGTKAGEAGRGVLGKDKLIKKRDWKEQNDDSRPKDKGFVKRGGKSKALTKQGSKEKLKILRGGCLQLQHEGKGRGDLGDQ